MVESDVLGNMPAEGPDIVSILEKNIGDMSTKISTDTSNGNLHNFSCCESESAATVRRTPHHVIILLLEKRGVSLNFQKPPLFSLVIVLLVSGTCDLFPNQVEFKN